MRYFADRVAMVKALPSGAVGAEIGVQRGEFSKEIFHETQVELLHLVDPWVHFDSGYDGDPANVPQGAQDENYRYVLGLFGGYYRAKIHRMTSLEAASRLPQGSLDFAYIDANHSYEHVLEDLRAWSRVVKPTGWLMGHDFIDNGWCRQAGFGVIEAVEDFCLESDWELTGLTTCAWSSFLLQKKP